jgi:putative hemolysin
MKALLSFGMLCLFLIPFAASQESGQIGLSQLNSPIKLHVNESTFLESENLQITLNHMDDSRCPSDVTCVWAGEAKAQLYLTRDEQNLGNLTLSTMEKNNSISFNGYLINLIKVDPYPTSTKNIQTADYLATILVSKESTLSPKQQIANGILPQDVLCSEGFTLMQKTSTNTAACVKPATAKILAERSWGTILKDATNSAEDSSPKQIANPASTYCFDHGGKIEMRESDMGVQGTCVFSDGSECEEWQYYRGECQPVQTSDNTVPSSLVVTTEKDQYATGEPINFTITNSGNTRLFPIGWGYSISGPNGEHYAPNGVLKMMLVALPPGNSTHWEWNQLDGNKTQASPGRYTITASYSEENTEKEIASSKLVEIILQ